MSDLLHDLHFNVFAKKAVEAAAVAANETAKNVTEPAYSVSTLTEDQQVAYTMNGILAIIGAMYWIQVFYATFWLKNIFNYASMWHITAATWPDFYSWWSFGDTITTGMAALVNLMTAIIWMLAPINGNLLWFLVAWIGISHYAFAITWAFSAVCKVMGFIMDHKTKYTSYNAWAKTYNVSTNHMLQWWDVTFQWAGMAISFGYYPNLTSIITDKEQGVGKKEEEHHDSHGSDDEEEEKPKKKRHRH